MTEKYYTRNSRADLLEMQKDMAPTLKTRLENLPEEILLLDGYWGLTKPPAEDKDDGDKKKKNKNPYSPMVGPRGGERAASTKKPEDFGHVFDCLTACSWKRPGFYEHLTFFCHDGYIGVDLDHCLDPETKELTPIAQDVLSILDTYTEYSRSKTGLHFICRGTFPPEVTKDALLKPRPKAAGGGYEIEIYRKKCLITTGDVFGDKPKPITDCTKALAILYKKYFGKENTKKEKPSSVPDAPLPDHEVERLLEDLPASDQDYDSWLRVAMALKSNGTDYEIFNEWCQQDAGRYTEFSNKYKWDGIKPEGGVSIGTLIWMWEQATGQNYRPSLAPQDANEAERKIWKKLRTNKSGIPLNSLANLATVLEPNYAGEVRINLLSNGLEIAEGDVFRPITDRDIYGIRENLSQRYFLEAKPGDIEAKLKAMAIEYHPIRDCIIGLQWDGKPRVKETFSAFFGCPKDEFHATAALLLFHGLICRAFKPGCKFDLCFILANPKQGTGKSTFSRYLAIDDRWYTDTAIDVSKPADAYRVERGHWVVELGELQAFKGKGVEELKSYLSACATTYCEKFDRHSEDMPRQVVFIGTSNKIECLPQDPSGNRRFIPIHCQNEPIAWDKDQLIANETKAREYIKQCFAEAYQIGKKNGWMLTPPLWMEKQLDTTRKDFVPEDPWVGVIQQYLDDNPAVDRVCTRRIWFEALQEGVRPREYTRTDLIHIQSILDNDIAGWKRGKMYKFGKKEGNHGKQVTWYRQDQSPRAPVTD